MDVQKLNLLEDFAKLDKAEHKAFGRLMDSLPMQDFAKLAGLDCTPMYNGTFVTVRMDADGKVTSMGCALFANKDFLASGKSGVAATGGRLITVPTGMAIDRMMGRY